MRIFLSTGMTGKRRDIHWQNVAKLLDNLNILAWNSKAAKYEVLVDRTALELHTVM